MKSCGGQVEESAVESCCQVDKVKSEDVLTVSKVVVYTHRNMSQIGLTIANKVKSI